VVRRTAEVLEVFSWGSFAQVYSIYHDCSSLRESVVDLHIADRNHWVRSFYVVHANKHAGAMLKRRLRRFVIKVASPPVSLG
jgi:hypothetical protein